MSLFRGASGYKTRAPLTSMIFFYGSTIGAMQRKARALFQGNLFERCSPMTTPTIAG